MDNFDGYTTHKYEPYKPPQRQWFGLTDEEMEYIWGITPEEYVDKFAFARAIEAKLKEKNGG